MKVAIKNMTAEQIRAEYLKIERQRQAIYADRDDLFERRDRLSGQRRELMARLDEIGKRLLEIANLAPGHASEVDDLLTQYSDLTDHIEMIMSSERDLMRDIDANFALEDALDRRKKHVMKRTWELQAAPAL